MDGDEFAGVLPHLGCLQRPFQIVGGLSFYLTQLQGFHVITSFR
jgi:hypothetical protein